MAVSWVSREWRVVAVFTSSLWNMVRVCQMNAGRGQLQIVDKIRPLHVHIDMHRCNMDEDGICDPIEPQTARIFHLILRWCTLDITGVNLAFLRFLRPLEDMAAPILQLLRVERDSDADTEDYDDPLRLFQVTNTAPALARAEILGFSCCIPCSSLTSLHLGSFPELEVDVLQLVEAAKSLVQLCIHLHGQCDVTEIFEVRTCSPVSASPSPGGYYCSGYSLR